MRRSREARVKSVPTRDEAEVEDVPEDEVPAAGGGPGDEDVAQAEDPAAMTGET